MKSMRRHILQEATFFLTVVTFERRPILLSDFKIFRDSWRNRELDAWVVLPDHFHVLLRLEKESISNVMHNFKISYSRYFRDQFGPGRVWQNRFWEHVVRDDEDLNRHLDYVHYNPVRHGAVSDPFQYEFSSLQIWHERGLYQRDWGVEREVKSEGLFGE
jgi:putative transposase